MKVLVTGANGYIGSKVIDLLCKSGHFVIAADLRNDHISDKAFFVKTNIFEDRDDWFSFFGHPDVCLHLAWRDGFVHNSDKHMLDLSGHFKFLKALVDGGLKHLAVMGTMHEVGYWEGVIDENTPCDPLSQYGIAKNALRKSIGLYALQKGVILQWMRAFYIFGDDAYGNSIFCKIKKAAEEGKKSFPFTMGRNKYDFISIDELSRQIVDVITQRDVTGVINVCSGKPVSLAEQVEWYIKDRKLDIKLLYGQYPDRPYDSPCIYGDNSKIAGIQKSKESVAFTEGK